MEFMKGGTKKPTKRVLSKPKGLKSTARKEPKKKSDASNLSLDANHIRSVIARRYAKMRWAVHYEVGLVKKGRLRADVVAMTMGAYFVIVEVKSSVADFRSDRKASSYLKYSNQTYFAMTAKVYSKVKDEIPKDFGVFVVSESSCKVVKKAMRRELDIETRLNLATRMAYRSADVTKKKRKSAAHVKASLEE